MIGEHIYAGQGAKVSSLLGAQSSGSPTVLAANGLICIGTDTGRVLVFDFKQTLKCVCGNESSGERSVHFIKDREDQIDASRQRRASEP